MKNYDVKGILLEGKKAVIAVALPEPARNNMYGIYKIYNISDEEGNKIVIHFKDFLGKDFTGDGGDFVSFIIDLNETEKNGILEIDFTKQIKVAFHHQNNELTRTPQRIYTDKYSGPFIPDTTGRGTIRESV
ncbi:hypothetical protein [Flavobacterium salmonis]|uniref:Uncharacterized protein n=1 Tax=Flavobacterium salmonis TaxID=2654844 RepID=A0A6V6YW34_9FLAO|nr:hypothetical protein [Flavobacterium salmonis]CAD0003737.1 hypothetical protein FLAT13_01830 [Flavobacterium salmonis]